MARRLFNIKYVGQVVSAVINDNAYKATKYVNDRYVIKATRRGKPDGRDSRRETIVTVGAPNYAEREFIKMCKRAGESFPVKKIQLRMRSPVRWS